MVKTGVMFTRKCRKCGLEANTVEELTLFVKRTELKAKYQNLCKECHRKHYKQGLDWVGHKYKISKEEYKRCMSTSAGCQICGSIKELCYDHDHNTMEFRGVLCRSCNKAIGALGDTEEGVRKALSYLVYHYHPNLFKNNKIQSSFIQEFKQERANELN